MPKKNTGPKLELNHADIYEIRWTEANRRSRRKSTNTSDLAEAQKVLARFIMDQSESNKVLPTSVTSVLDAYNIEHVQERVVAKDRQEGCITVIKAGLGEYDVRELTPDVIRSYRDKRKAGKVNGYTAGDSTLRRELNCLVAAINHAVRHRRLPLADVPHIDLPEAPPPKDLWLAEDELTVLIDAASKVYSTDRLSRVYRFVVLAAETAARKTSIVRLRWSQVDLKAGLIHFQNDGNARTKKRRVPVPMSDLARQVLERAWNERTQDEWVMDNPYSIQHHFDAVKAKAAGMAGQNGQKYFAVTPHTLRHTWATHAARAGVPLFEIAGVLGDTLATVMRVYAHHCPDHLRGAVNFRSKQPASLGNLVPFFINESQQESKDLRRGV
jgi:integrase